MVKSLYISDLKTTIKDIKLLTSVYSKPTNSPSFMEDELKQFLLCKMFFDRINHHQLLNEYVLYNFFALYQTLLIVKSN